MPELRKNYQQDDALRGSFNALAEKTFGLNFEPWYRNGFWQAHYIPYSMVEHGAVVANVSVNRTDMIWNGRRCRLIQLGTVMTDEPYRGRGLIRALMEEIRRDFAGRVDGAYLFANDGVLGLYPKFGFRPAQEYECVRALQNAGPRTILHRPARGPADWSRLTEVIRASVPCGSFHMADDVDLYLFYLSGFLQDAVWYDAAQDAWAVAEQEGEELLLHGVFAPHPVDPEALLRAFGAGVRQVRFGFAPSRTAGCRVCPLHEADTTLFVAGDVFADFEAQRLRFPTLAHA